MASFEETSDMASALPEATKSTTNGTTKLTGQQLREAGWTEPQAFDYETADLKPSEAAPQAPAENGEEVPGWAHNAAKYEWLEEYGDVGPRIKQLERQLFQSEYLNRRGVKFDK